VDVVMGPASHRSTSITVLAAVLVLHAAGGRPVDASAQAPAPADTLAVSLASCVDRALAVGEEMREAEVTRAVAHARYLQARSSALPQLHFHASYTRQVESIFGDAEGGIAPFSPDTTASLEDRVRALEDALPGSGYYALDQLFSSLSFASKNSWNVGLTLEQKIFQGGSIWGSVSAAKHALRAAELMRDDSREDVIFRVRQAYLDALLADRTLDVQELGLEEAETRLSRVRLRHENGAVSDFDLLQAEVQRDNLVPAVAGAREDREMALAYLRRLANLPETPLALTTRLLETPVIPGDAAADTSGITGEALAGSGITALEEVLAARGHAVTVASAGKWPELSIFAGVSQQAFPGSFFPDRRDWLREKSLGFQVQWDLFDGFLTKGAIREAKAERDRAAKNVSDASERLAETVTRGRLDLERVAAELRSRRRTVELARRALDLAGLRYEEGASSLIEVTEARIAWQIAAVHEARARRDYFVSLALLERSSGRPLFGAATGEKESP
jgi:outer membrane protein